MNKSIGKFILTAVALSMVFAVFACVTPSAQGAVENYNVWCNNERFTSEDLTVDCGSGTAVYEPATQTLTLTDATIDKGCNLGLSWGKPGIYALVNLNIIVIGDNVIDIPAGTGIDTYDGGANGYSVVITGDGSGSSSLTITAADTNDGYGIYTDGDLDISDVTLYLNTYCDGLSAEGVMTITDSVVVINNFGGNYTFGIEAYYCDTVLIDGSVIVGNVQPMIGTDYDGRSFILLYIGDELVLTNDSMIITYDPAAGPFILYSGTSLVYDPSGGDAMWDMVGEDCGITYSNGTLSGFVPIADVTVEPLYYDVWCNGEQFANNHLTIDCGSGTAVYDPVAGTLTLTNATITNGCTGVTLWGEPGIFTSTDLEIILVGDNIIDIEDGSGIETYYDYGPLAKLTIRSNGTDPGSLTVCALDTDNGYGITPSELTVIGVTLYLQTYVGSIDARNGVTITDSVVVIDMNILSDYGIYAQYGGDIRIDGSVIVGNIPMLDLIISASGDPYDLMNDSIVISYDPSAGPFIIYSDTSLDFDPSGGDAMWDIVGGDGGITYSNGGLSGFVAIPDVDVIYADVTGITVTGMGGATAITTAGGTLQMIADVLPTDADPSVTWSVINGTGSATINATGLLTAVTNGTVTVRATANDGTGIYGELVITISQPVPVTAITVSGTGGATEIATNGGTLQMSIDVSPADATDKSVIWSVVDGTGSATISETGLLTAVKNGTVTVTATAADGSGTVGELVVTISGQAVPDDRTAPEHEKQELNMAIVALFIGSVVYIVAALGYIIFRKG